MQTRTCFNGGEMSPELGARADMDAYMRGCRTVENWELSEMGGVKRRKGMKGLRKGIPGGARLVPFIYSYATTNMRFLVMLSAGKLEVVEVTGKTLAEFKTDLDFKKVRYLQINAVMLLLDGAHAIKELRVDEAMKWTYKDYEIEVPGWRYTDEKRDHGVRLTKQEDGLYTVEFDDDEEDGEREVEQVGDEMRLSFWVDQAEAKDTTKRILDGVAIVEEVQICGAGQKFAVKGETVQTYWVCKQEFPVDVIVPGLDDPADYPDNFEEAVDVSSFGDTTQVVHKLSEVKQTGGKIAKNTVFILENGYWEYYTSTQAFTGFDIKEGYKAFGDYPDFFTRGVPIGDALPCGGKWNFYCSGIWFGSYEVKKNYETGELNGEGEWETAGISFSRLGEGSNEQLTGDESDEECYLRLFITRSKRMSENPKDGFPPEACGNRLIVPGYRHDMRLKVKSLDGGEGKPRFEDVTKVKVPVGTVYTKDWSWGAWSGKYGYPICAAVCQQRLILASTVDQPQTLWMSRVDDYTNFGVGDSDDSALVVTLYSVSQDPICWITEERNQILLGTTEGEWTVGMANSMLTPEKCIACKCDRVGSQGDMYLDVNTQVLFVERGSGRVYRCGYNYEIDGYRSEDLSVFAPHIMTGHHGVVQATLLRKPNRVAVFLMGDGMLALLTYNSQHEVQAWHRWTTNGLIYSVCALPNGNNADSLFLSVQRGNACWLEVMEEGNDFVDNGENDYVSLLETNALMNPLEQKIERECKYPVAILFGCDIQKDLLRLKAWGTEWTGVAREAPVLVKGWHQLLTLNGWRYENSISLQFHGNAPCEILALQG